MPRDSSRIVALLAFTLLGAPRVGVAQNKDPYLLTHVEIVDHPTVTTAYEAVEQLRPRFLRATRVVGGTSPGGNSHAPRWTSTDDRSGGDNRSEGILVVINGVRAGGVTELRRIPAIVIITIHYLSGTDASGTYGNEQAGVIEVKLSPTPIKPD